MAGLSTWYSVFKYPKPYSVKRNNRCSNGTEAVPFDECSQNLTMGRPRISAVAVTSQLNVQPQVRVRNLTYQQPFSPPVVVAHTKVSFHNNFLPWSYTTPTRDSRSIYCARDVRSTFRVIANLQESKEGRTSGS